MPASIDRVDYLGPGQPALPAERKPRRSLAFLLLGAGLLLAIYVGTQYLSTYRAQRSLVAEWMQQNNAPARTEVGSSSVVRVSIPKIQLDAFVVEGTSGKALLHGLGHLEDTPEPGERGNAVLAAHRDTFFHHLPELNPGDDVYVRWGGREYRYVVTRKTVVEPSDLSVTDNTADSRLTLITCYPTYYIGPAPQRLVVLAKLVGQSP
jgi:LPXTG-site transpeptidase (sortase) family protein